MPAQNHRWGGRLKATCIGTYLLMLYTQHIGYSTLDCGFWSAEQPLPEPQQAGQSQGMNRDCSLLNRIQTPWQEGFNVILVTGFNTVTSDRKTQVQHKANQPTPKHLSDPASVAARAQKRWEQCFANSKHNLRWFVPGTMWCSITSANFSNTLNLPEVKSHLLLLLSQLAPTFSYIPGMNPLFLIFAV